MSTQKQTSMIEPSTSSIAPAPKPWRGRLLFALKLAVSLGIVSYLIYVTDWERARDVLARTNWRIAWIAPLLSITGLFIAGQRWRLLLKAFGLPIGWLEPFILYLSASYYAIILPGWFGSDALRILLYARTRTKLAVKAGMTVLAERTMGFTGLLILAACMSFFTPIPAIEAAGVSLRIFLPLAAGVGLLALASLLFLSSRLPRPHNTHHGWSALWNRTFMLAHTLSEAPSGTWPKALILSSGYQFCDFLGAFCLAQALGLEIGLLQMLLVMPLANLITILPISLGGVGIREGTLTFLLVQLGVPLSDALMLCFLIFLARLVVYLTGGIVHATQGPHLKPQNP